MATTNDPMGLAFRIIVVVVRPLLALLTKCSIIGAEHIPERGPAIIASNHLSMADPPVAGMFLYERGRVPHFLGKASVFRIPIVGTIVRSAGNIPVERRSVNAAAALVPAKKVLDAGRCIVIYPEGTLTHDESLWPMKGKTGAVRLALMTGAPLLPTAVWGTQRLFGLHSRKFPLFPRTRVMMAVGAPVDISDLLDRADNADALREGTARLMTAITDLLAGLRGERPPASASVQQ